MNKILEINEERLTFKGHSDWVRAIAVTPDGKTVISGSWDNTIKIWDLETRKEKFTFKGHSGWVKAIAVTPDGKTVISSSGDSNIIKTYDLETEQEITVFPSGVTAIAVTPDGKIAVFPSGVTAIALTELL
ncbi:MAG: WD40 repeat domain-containing protein [Dolichospermum sp.]